MKKGYSYIGLLFGHMLVLALLLLPVSPVEVWLPYMDKLIHVVLFCLLSILTITILGGRWWTTIIGLMGYAFLIEVVQDLMGVGRTFDWVDWGVGVVGIMLGALLVLISKKY